MNIFRVLSRGDGTIQEPNITAVLSYLLDPIEDHGMRHLFLIKFLTKLKEEKLSDNKIFDNDFKVAETSFANSDSELNTIIEVEKRLELENKTRDIDISLELWKANNLLFRLIIEIKIYKESFNNNQLEDIVELSKDNLVDSDKTIYILLAPQLDDKVSKGLDNKNFIEINWKEFISEIFKEILVKENIGEISPINNQTKDLLKSFNVFINDDFKDKDNLLPDIFKAEFIKNNEVKSTFSVEDKKPILEFMIDVLKEILNEKDIRQRKQSLIQLNDIHKRFRNFIRTIENMEAYCNREKVNTVDVLTKRYKLLQLKDLTLIKPADIKPTNIKTEEYVYISTQVSAAGKINELLYFVENLISSYGLNEYKFKVEKRFFTGAKKPTSKKNWKKEDYIKIEDEYKK